MQHAYRFNLIFGLSLLVLGQARAQSLVGGFMAGKGHGSVVMSGTAERYQSVFLVPETVKSVPIFNEVRVSSVSVYANYGISNKVEAVVSLPYIEAQGRANAQVLGDLGYTNTRRGLQDISALVKFKTYSLKLGNNTLDLLGVAGVSTPASNYQTNTGLEYIIAIGNRATKLNTMGIAHLKLASGVFLTGQAGYSLRDNRVPNAFVADAKIGYAGVKFYSEAWASFQKSSSKGTDILQPGFDSFFPATQVNFTRIGISVYRPIISRYGLVLGASQYVTGRNVGRSTGISAGISGNF